MSVGSRESIKRSMIHEANSTVGICEKIRFIYDEVYEIEDKEKREKITELLVDAMVMAKKMADRLTYYHETYNDTTGNDGKNLERVAGASGRKVFRRDRNEKV